MPTRCSVYTLRVGSRRAERDLSRGVEPDVHWRWRPRWVHNSDIDEAAVTRALRHALDALSTRRPAESAGR